jgi:hypothetical protein
MKNTKTFTTESKIAKQKLNTDLYLIMSGKINTSPLDVSVPS